MADEVVMQPGAGRRGGGRLMPLLIIAVLMVGEGIGIFLLANSLGANPSSAIGAEGAPPGAGGAVEDPNALAEVTLAECRPGNTASCKYISFSIRVSVLVAPGDRERVEQLVREKRARIEDRIKYVIRSAELRQLYEPGFETVKRRRS